MGSSRQHHRSPRPRLRRPQNPIAPHSCSAGRDWRPRLRRSTRRASEAADSVRVDTVRIAAVRHPEVLTVSLPVTAPSGVVSEVPIDVVRVAAFDSLGRSCDRLQHDCAAALAAKVSAA